MSAFEQYKSYLDAVARASARARSVLYLVLVTCLVVMAAIRYGVTSISGPDIRLLNAKTYSDLRSKSPDELAPAESQFIKSYLETNPVVSEEGFIKRLEVLEESREQGKHLSMPVLGLPFDVTDLPLITALALSLLLWLLYFSMSRELKNFQTARDAIKRLFSKDEDRRVAYELLGLTQVLNVSKTERKRPWYSLKPGPAWVLFIPPITQFLLDLGYSVAWFRSPHLWDVGDVPAVTGTMMQINSLIILTFSWLCWILVLWTSSLCSRLWVKINEQIKPEDNPSLLGSLNPPVDADG